MIKVFGIDFVRAIIGNALDKIHAEDSTLFSSEDIFIMSFYEHLQTNAEVDRYVELYNDLIKQQNRDSYKGYGIVATTNSPSITNLRNNLIIPFEWSLNIRTKMYNRDKMIETIYALISKLKGKKKDVAQLDNGKLFVVGTIGENVYNNLPCIESGDFLGTIAGVSDDTEIKAIITDLTTNKGISNTLSTTTHDYIYVEKGGKLCRYDYEVVSGANAFVLNETAIPSHTSFEKYKVSLSYDDVKINEPYTLDANENCEVISGGSATLCGEEMILGNDLVRVFIGKDYLRTGDNSTYSFKVNNTIVYYDIEPLEMPSGTNLNNLAYQLKSNNMVSNSHADSVNISLNYSFAYDKSIELLKQWYKFGRYGDMGLSNVGAIQNASITPNIVYSIKEYMASWGNVDLFVSKAKINEDLDIENSDTDVMTIKVGFQVQGAND